MIIKEIHIDHFRAINNMILHLGGKLTAIAGQNGTMKTTILGMIGQPFSLRNDTSKLGKALTIEGLKFDSPFRDKFKFSYPDYDKPGEHRWKLVFYDGILPKPAVEIVSIRRSEPQKNIDELRFWLASGRTKGIGYVKLPVIYLSLKRLIPIGEEDAVKRVHVDLSDEEIEFYRSNHNSILHLDEPDIEPEYIQSPNKRTLGAKTARYDSLTNSAGQDNVGKILLAVMSFARLKRDYPNEYKGGLLLIDELEATLFPAAQKRLVRLLAKFARDYKIQIVFTTHSMCILETIAEYDKRNGDIMLLYLVKSGDDIVPYENPPLEAIRRDINIEADLPQKPQKITVYCEDEEARVFLKGILPKSIKQRVSFAKENLGCENLKSLSSRGVREFCHSIIVLDGDSKLPSKKHGNFVKLPGNERPENMLFKYLYSLDDNHPIWDRFGEGRGYTRQYCIRNGKPTNRVQAKEWFNEQKPYWGRDISRVMKFWRKDNQELVNNFISDFVKAYNAVASKNGVPSL